MTWLFHIWVRYNGLNLSIWPSSTIGGHGMWTIKSPGRCFSSFKFLWQISGIGISCNQRFYSPCSIMQIYSKVFRGWISFDFCDGEGRKTLDSYATFFTSLLNWRLRKILQDFSSTLQGAGHPAPEYYRRGVLSFVWQMGSQSPYLVQHWWFHFMIFSANTYRY